MRYSTVENWAEYFKKTEGVQISSGGIRRRLKNAEIIGITGRNKIGRVFKNAFYSENDVREACANLLMRPEEKKEKAIQALVSHGISDRDSLLSFGVVKFTKTDFLPFRKGTAFASVILGEVLEFINFQILERIADTLGFTNLSEEEKKQQYIQALAAHNINNRQSLLVFGVSKFTQTDFSRFGKGAAFTSAILGESIHPLKSYHLNLIADVLGLPTLSEEETKQQYLSVLASHCITDLQSLLAFGITKFRETNFPPFGQGTAFASVILGETVKSLAVDHISRIADVLDLPNLSKETKQQYIQVIGSHGIHDHQALIQLGPKQFTKTDFPPFGKGTAFASSVLGEPVNNITIPILNLIADILFGKDEK